MTKKSNGAWIYWICACLVIIFVLWLFYSDGPQEFVGIPTYIFERQDETPEELAPEQSPPIIVEDRIPATPRIPYHELLNNAVFTAQMNQESKGEMITRRAMERLFGKAFIRVRPNFLRNPETGANLELDGYNEELKIAFEYNGIQHYSFPGGRVKTEEDFKKQLRRDRFKLETCNRLGIYLIIVPYRIPHENILHDIWHKLHPTIRAKVVVPSVE